MPCSIALRHASSAASCAANGVDLREPLKPRLPALDHATVLPLTSVIVTTVLLNVDWIWAMPVATFFLTFFLVGLPLAGVPAAAVFALAIISYSKPFTIENLSTPVEPPNASTSPVESRVRGAEPLEPEKALSEAQVGLRGPPR